MPALGIQFSRQIASLASSCLIDEANLTPKPGLVDRRGSGAHTDLTLDLMETSARTLKTTFEEIALTSWGRCVDSDLRSDIGLIGRTGEKRMMEVTGGINTHRGAIWTLGLLVAATSSLKSTKSLENIAQHASALARLPDTKFRNSICSESNGLRVKRLYKKTGAREEAQAGFPHIMKKGLPTIRTNRCQGLEKSHAEINTLLSIMTTLSDTCVLSRAGPSGLKTVQEGATKILSLGGIGTASGAIAFYALDKTMRQLRLSPGGAADLLAGTFFLDRLSIFNL